MPQRYELASLSFPLLAGDEVSAGALAWVSAPDAKGVLLGGWRTELGTLGRLLVLRAFESADELENERHRALLSDTPFNGRGKIQDLTMESYLPFPFLPLLETGARGGVYEFRTYRLQPGGLRPTLAGWQQAICPAHDYTTHLVTNMYAQDGPARITHIWAFSSLEERARLRAQAYGAGVWPPTGGPDNIREATATIALPERWSPLT